MLAVKHSAGFSTSRPHLAIEEVKWVNLNQFWFSPVEVHYFLQVKDHPPGSEPTQDVKSHLSVARYNVCSQDRNKNYLKYCKIIF